tara:strand:+ start:1103 stop:1213 length:111 start_codon:yes stop_codon:yes gene_type:complete
MCIFGNYPVSVDYITAAVAASFSVNGEVYQETNGNY